MLDQIKGIHHVTSMAANAGVNNRFFTETLGLRRVKKTVNFDAPDIYHLYYGDERGTPGSVMTYFPYPHIAPRRAGAGEVGVTRYSIPEGSLDYWRNRLSEAGVLGVEPDAGFGENRLNFLGPDGEGFSLVEVRDDPRAGWTGSGIGPDVAIHGFHSTSMRLREDGASSELLQFMGYERIAVEGGVTRFKVPDGNRADIIDIETVPGLNRARQGAGSVHHVAFAVENRDRHAEVHQALADTGYKVTPIIDRNYFRSIYFRAPGGVLFEIATNEPGFDIDEDVAHLGQSLQLPPQHAHLRERLEETLEALP